MYFRVLELPNEMFIPIEVCDVFSHNNDFKATVMLRTPKGIDEQEITSLVEDKGAIAHGDFCGNHLMVEIEDIEVTDFIEEQGVMRAMILNSQIDTSEELFEMMRKCEAPN